MTTPLPPACAHCGGVPGEAFGADLYPYRPDLAETAYWHCRPCEAWIAKGSEVGRPANAGLRRWRRDFHAVFDPLWRRKMERDGVTQKAARSAAYQWLASEMVMDVNACHGAFFNLEQATTAYVICRKYQPKGG